MTEATLSGVKSLPPYIRGTDSLGKRFWGQGIALLPVLIAACLSGHTGVLRVLLLCLVSVVAFEYLAAKLFGKKENLRSGEALVAASLFSLLVPFRCPSEIVISGIFITVAAREFFGGTGSYPLQPLLLARTILQISFPALMNGPMFLTGGDLGSLAGIGLGGIFLVSRKRGYWETPILFMVVCFACENLGGGSGNPVVFSSGVLFTAFFLLADPAALPLTRKGCALFSVGAAFLSSTLEPGGFSIGAAFFARLWMGLLTPWLDVAIKPVPRKTKHLLKATYTS